MARTLCLHLDECCHVNLFEALPLHGIDVTTAGSVRLLSESDEAQLEFARSSRRVLFTHDADFIALHQSGVEHAGIAYCDRKKRTVGEMVRLLCCFGRCTTPTKWSIGWNISNDPGAGRLLG